MKHSELNTELRGYFENGDIPTQIEFRKLIDAATDNTTTFSLLAHLFGATVDCAISEPDLDLESDLTSKLADYSLVPGEQVILHAQQDITENGVYIFDLETVEGETIAKLTKQAINEFEGMLIKANRSLDDSASYYHYVMESDTDQNLDWHKVENFDVPEYYSEHIQNARFPAEIDLTQQDSVENSKLTANYLVGNGAAITDLNNANLPAQIDLTQIDNDSSLKAKEIIGDGQQLTGLDADQLQFGQVPPQRIDFAQMSDIESGSSVKVLNADHGYWLNQKVESLGIYTLIQDFITCAEVNTHIDTASPLLALDGVSLQAGDLVLLTAQLEPSENRIWQIQPNKTLSLPSPEIALSPGAAVKINAGTVHQHKVFVLASQFENLQGDVENQWQASAQVTLAGAGIKVINNQHSVDVATPADIEAGVTDKLLDAAQFKAQQSSGSDALKADYNAKITVQKERIDSILEASDADADSFKEIVDLINSVDTESDQAFASYVLSNDQRSAQIETDLATESSTRLQEVASLQTALQQEVSDRTADSASRYTKTEADQRFLKSVNTQLVGTVDITQANFNGNMTVSGAITATGDVTAFSDARLKSNIKPITEALAAVGKLEGVTFERADGQCDRRYTGLIAQNVEQACPEAVYDQDDYKSVAYGNLVGLLVESIKELNNKVISLENQVAKLESE
ncbi:tail fiber domain-containing protein [Pseudoalteromonas luteoviolacea]|uniref:tail fiber domain-containing protein n=1 Tax=Pseudoalteromonas luteoviolacea TaxID=43657 RepID=UPI001F2E6169|nr:tail fiber domain-containing protein [Pseudoalteromonas luteoviolacea]MCF6440858.1 tail fiber domain-containing protein [Pseudoalteromonas luteoviolacea]